MMDKFQILADEVNLQYVRAEDMVRLTGLPAWEKAAEILFELQEVAVGLMDGVEIKTYKETEE